MEDDTRTHYFDRSGWTDREIYYREAMVNLLLGRVVWVEAKGWVSIPDMMPEDAVVRVGLIEAWDETKMCRAWHPLVIVHDTTNDLIARW
jgi:hypothetical protein